jgi:hypothetical protein
VVGHLSEFNPIPQQPLRRDFVFAQAKLGPSRALAITDFSRVTAALNVNIKLGAVPVVAGRAGEDDGLSAN